jgi:fucose permease
VAAGVAYLVLIGLLTAAAAWGLGWRAAVLVTLVVPVVARWNTRGLVIEESVPSADGHGPRLPRAFWVVAAILVCTTAVEWSVTAWGATFVEEATSVSSDTAVSLMAAYFGGFLGGRVLGSRLARRTVPESLLAWAVGMAFLGFVVLWTSTSPAQAALGLAVLGAGVGNLFPMTLSAAVAAAPGRAGQASGRAVATSSAAVLLAPLAIGTIADSTSLKAALCVVPALLGLAGAGLVVLSRVRATTRPASDPTAT